MITSGLRLAVAAATMMFGCAPGLIVSAHATVLHFSSYEDDKSEDPPSDAITKFTIDIDTAKDTASFTASYVDVVYGIPATFVNASNTIKGYVPEIDIIPGGFVRFIGGIPDPYDELYFNIVFSGETVQTASVGYAIATLDYPYSNPNATVEGYYQLSAVPLPPSAPLLGGALSALGGFGLLQRRRKLRSTSSAVAALGAPAA